jgi:hypothetical protein
MRSAAALAVLVTGGLGAAIGRAAEAQAITVDLKSPVVERFMGLGVQWDPYDYPPSPEAWKTTLDRVRFLRPGLLRVMLNATSYLRGFDAGGKPRYVWSAGESGMERLASLFAILDYAQAHRIDVLLGEWSPARGLNVGGTRVGADDPHWAAIHADFAVYLKTVKKYDVVRYFNFMNEPNGGWMWPGGKVDYAAWAQGIRNLRQELDARGMDWLRIAGPDNSGNWEWLDRCAAELRRQIGAWEMHWYAKDAEVLDGGIEKLLAAKREMLRQADPMAASKPLFIGESGMIEGKVNGDQQPRVKEFQYGVRMADYVAQVARAGWGAAIAWDLDDAMHVNTGGRTVPPGPRTLKIWGFWNTQGAAMGAAGDERVRPWFYTWSLMSRLFPKGSRIVVSRSAAEAPHLRTLAAAWRDGAVRRISVMVVNDGGAPGTVMVRVPGGGRSTVDEYRYFAQDRPADENGYPVPARQVAARDLAKGIRIELPAEGVVFLSARR